MKASKLVEPYQDGWALGMVKKVYYVLREEQSPDVSLLPEKPKSDQSSGTVNFEELPPYVYRSVEELAAVKY